MSEITVRLELRTRLMRFLNRRERAYKEILKKGFKIPDYAEKTEAIQAIRVQLAASTDWTLRSHYLWICAMQEKICKLLPFEFHDDHKQITYRKHILELLAFCDDQVNSKPLFQNSNNKAA